MNRTHNNGELRITDVNKKVELIGWVAKKRNLGALVFVDLRDRHGITQVIFDESFNEQLKDVKNEYILDIKGTVVERSSKNPDMPTGDIEIQAEEVKIVNKAATTPMIIADETDALEETRMKYRYLDLRRPALQKNIMRRAKIIRAIHEYLDSEEFVEIETPYLNKSTPEGARDFLVPSRVHNGSFYALPQSPQLFKQLLMVAGFERYYQIARCFRDEDLRADRQPEFTQVDVEMSFMNTDQVIGIGEGLIKKVMKDVMNIDVQLPFPRMTWHDAMETYGIDKPDTRFGMELINVTDVVKDCGFGVFSGAVANGGTVRGLNAKGQGEMARKKIDALVEFVKTYGAKGLAYIAMHEDGTIKSSFAKFMTEEEMNNLIAAMGGEPGDLLLFAADKNKVVWDSLGALRLELAKQMDIIPEGKWNFLWITEFPQFEWSDEQGRFLAMHHPFTMPMEEDIQYLISDPGRVRAKAYDIVLNGTELGGGSVRIHQADVQAKMFEALGFTPEQANEKFGFLLTAFKYGVPPHAGLAYGLDRLVMHMAGEDNIREVIAFPKVKDASCLMTDAPNVVDDVQLQELQIKLDLKEKEQ